MKNVSSAFAAAIAARTVKIAELYILELADGTIYRKTTHNQPIIWDAGGNTYTPMVAERSEVTFTTNFEVGEVAIALSKISLEISDHVTNDILERSVLTIKRIRWDASYASDEEFIVFKGFLDIDFNRKVLNLTAKSKFANLSVQIPKFVYEECCNYNLFDSFCGLEKGPRLYDSYISGIDFQESAYWYLTDHVWLAQTFTPNIGYDIRSVILKLYRISSPGTVTVSIKITDGNGEPTGADLCSGTINGNDVTTDTDGEEVIFSLSPSYTLVANTKYAIILKSPVAQIPAYINWKTKKENSGYPGDIFYSWDAGATWLDDWAFEDSNFYFKTYDTDLSISGASYAYAGTATDGTRATVVDVNRGSTYKVAFDGGNSNNPIERGEVIIGGDNVYTAKVVQIIYLTSSTGYVWYVELSNANNFDNNETLTSGGDSIVVNGTPAVDTTFYELGEIDMTSGDNSGQKRPIALDSAGTITVLWPFVTAIVTGDGYDVYPGCDLRATTCGLKFNNGSTHRSFRHVPRIEDTIL